VNRRPVVGLWEGIAIHHTDERLPYCGNMQFLRTSSEQGISTEYEEGTFDNRKVRAVH
jgi:hypothetical protein